MARFRVYRSTTISDYVDIEADNQGKALETAAYYVKNGLGKWVVRNTNWLIVDIRDESERQ